MVKQQRGQALIIIAVCLLAIVGLLALVVDTGRAYIDHSRLQRAVDSAVLAGVQKLPSKSSSEAEALAQEAFNYNMNQKVTSDTKLGVKNYNTQITALAGNPRDPGNLDRLFVTADTTVYNQLAGFLGYDSWPIMAQAGARIGPIGAIEHWIPIGVEEGAIELYTHYRLGNTTHNTSDNMNGEARPYVPLNRGNLRQGVSTTIKSTLTVGQKVDILQNPNIKDVCSGVDDRIRNKVGTKGCFEIDDTVPTTEGLNLIGKGYRKDWGYGQDPRLVYVPFVRQIDRNSVQVVGFGLFYIEYAHYDTNAFGTDSELSELVGFFVQTIVEGPISDESFNYGVMGIEYIDFL